MSGLKSKDAEGARRAGESGISGAASPGPNQSLPVRRTFWGRWYFAAVLAAVLLALPGLGEKHFFTRGEPREAVVISQMLRTGDFILPRGYGGAVPSKPPLMHWAASVFSYPAGVVTEFTARLPSALASILFVVYFFPFIARRTSAFRALIACVMLVSSFEWFRSATLCRVDLLLSVLLALGLLESFRWRERELSGLPWGAILAFSGATLTKGPVSLILPAMILGLYLLASGISFPRATFKTAQLLLLSCLLPAAWYYAAYLKSPQEFSAKFYSENIARFLGQMEDDAHRHSVGYLLGALAYGLLPWLAPALPGCMKAAAGFLKALVSKQLRLKELTNGNGRLEFFCLLSAFLIILFFSIPSSKRSVYLLPAYPFIAILFSKIFDLESNMRSWSIERFLSGLLGAAVLLVCSAAALVIAIPAAGETAAKFVAAPIAPILTGALAQTPVFGTTLMLVIVAAIALAVLIRSLHDRPHGFAAVVLWIAFLAAANIVSTPFANQLGNDRFASQIRPLLQKDPAAQLYSYELQFFGASFYLGRQILYFDLDDPQPGYLLTSPEHIQAIEAVIRPPLKLEKLLESQYPDTKPNLFPLLLRITTESQ